MLSFQDKQDIKEFYQKRYQEHTPVTSNADGFVMRIAGVLDYRKCSEQLQVPTWLVHLADYLFDKLPRDTAIQFGASLLEAIPVGLDLEHYKHKLAISAFDPWAPHLPFIQECVDYHAAALSGLEVTDFNDEIHFELAVACLECNSKNPVLNAALASLYYEDGPRNVVYALQGLQVEEASALLISTLKG